MRSRAGKIPPRYPATPEIIEGDTVLDEKNEEDPEDGSASSPDKPPRCPPPRWATGLRRVLYPDVTIDEAETPSGS
jgi:hypothetical protein